MKKTILLVAASMLAIVGSAVTYMRVKTLTNQDVKFNIGNVKQVDYEKDAATAKRYMYTKTAEGKTYKYDVEKITNVDYVDANINFDTLGTAAQQVTVDGQINGYTFVDLGLKSGLLWATYNVGATKPTESGLYISWGETQAKNTIAYAWNRYKWCKGSSTTITKYCKDSNYGEVDSLGFMLIEDDAVAANWGSVWRMPTISEFYELNEGCDWKWTDDYNGSGVAGYVATSKTNKNTIFFPAAGVMSNSGIISNNSRGRYWAADISPKRSDYAFIFNLLSDAHTTTTTTARYYGHTVRPVAKIAVEKHVVTFYSADSTEIDRKSVLHGSSAIAPNAPALKGFLFVGWSDSSFVNVEKDLSIYAQYMEEPKVDGVSVSGESDGYTYVDLGLKSGVMWATYNVGATNPNEYGDKFEWGETTPREKSVNWSDYKWCEGSNKTLTKYCIDKNYGTVDNVRLLEAEDDAVSANWGGVWRMPTIDDIEELIDGCKWVFTDDFQGTGVAGNVGTSLENGKVIFLPSLDASTSSGYYWSSKLSDQSTVSSYALSFESSKSITTIFQERMNVFHVRGVFGKHYTVNFYSADSTLLTTQSVEDGRSAIAPDAPVIEGFKFVGWSSNGFSNVKSNMNIYAKYKQTVFTVNFFNADSMLIETHKVGADTALVAPSVDYIEKYDFIGWSDSSFTKVQKDINTYAVYKKVATVEGLTITGKLGDYSYVDLGLSVLWATQNVGAKPNKATDFGGYYAWAETAEKKTYYPNNYKWSDNTQFIPHLYPETPQLTKYSTVDYGVSDGIRKLLPEDDAATVNMGSPWRTPTQSEMKELMEKCKWTWTTINGVGGCLVTSKVEGYTDNSIFIPSAGFKKENNLYNEQDRICLWTSEVNSARNWVEAYTLDYMKGINFEIFNVERYDGFNVRAVMDKSNIK